MSLFPCSICGQRRPGKLASAYWAWFLADGSRSAWRQRICASCAPSTLSALLKSANESEANENVFACVACGASTDQDSDPVYLTLYLPKREAQEFAIQLDSACAVKVRVAAQHGAEKLPDRGGEVRGPSPDTSAWDALGLAP